MQISYVLSESDIVDYELYQTSNSEILRKRRTKKRWIIGVSYTLIGLVFLIISLKSYVGWVFMVIGILWWFFYPAFAKWTY